MHTYSCSFFFFLGFFFFFFSSNTLIIERVHFRNSRINFFIIDWHREVNDSAGQKLKRKKQVMQHNYVRSGISVFVILVKMKSESFCKIFQRFKEMLRSCIFSPKSCKTSTVLVKIIQNLCCQELSKDGYLHYSVMYIFKAKIKIQRFKII